MNKVELDQYLKLLSEAPDSQISELQTSKLIQLYEKPIDDIISGLEKIISDCVNFSESSEFSLFAIQTALSFAKDIKSKENNKV